MGDISNGLPPSSGYQSPENRNLERLAARLTALEEEVDRMKADFDGRALAQQEAYRRMMTALSGASVVGEST